MEIWDVLDGDRQPTGRTMVRGEEFREGDYHVVIHICIFNSEGKLLIQQRQSFKEGWPNKWDITVGGSAVAGDTSREAAHRELLEELGIDVDFSDIRPVFTVNNTRAFDDYYVLKKEIELSELKLQEEEVQAARFASFEEIMEMLERDEFIPYYPSFIGFLFDSHGHRGTHVKRQYKSGLK